MNLSIETKIHLNKFVPKDWQKNLFVAVENEGYKKILAIWPRRSAKTLCSWIIMIRQAVMVPALYAFCLPTFKQARLCVWNAMTNDGTRFLDYIPPQLIESKNESEMKIRLKNGSVIQLIGSDTYDTSLVGTNFRMIVFDEMALSDKRALDFARPILNANGGIMMVLSTPRGRNSLWELYNIAKTNPDYYVSFLTLNETQHISKHEIEKEIASSELSLDLSLQEYYCDFEIGIEGAFYTRQLDKMRLEGRIGNVPWEPHLPVNCSFDLGVRDSTTILWFQVAGREIRIIDEYSNQKVGLEHYVKVIKEKDYNYNKFLFPPDVRVRELTTGMTRVDKLEELGIKVTIVDRMPVIDGIELVRSTLPRMWIDEKCKKIILALERYRQEFDDKRKVYKNNPLHDQWSDWCDNLRYACLGLPKLERGITAEELEERYQRVMNPQGNLPKFFQQDYGGGY